MNRSHWPVSILSVLASVVGIFLPLVLVRLLTPEEIGQFKLFFLYITVVYAFSLAPGFQSGLGYWGGRKKLQPAALPASFNALALIALILFPISYFLTPYLLSAGSYTAILFAASVSLWIVGRFFDEAAVSIGRIWSGAVLYAGFELLRSLTLISAALIFKTLDAVLLAHALISLGKVLVGLVVGSSWQILGGWTTWVEIKRVGTFALPVSIAWMFGLFINYADQLVVAQLVSPAAFALFSLGCLQLPPLYAYEQGVTRVLIPQLSEAIAQNQNQLAAISMRRAISQLLYIMLPATIGVAIFAEPITDLLFTVRYHDAAIYMRWYAFSYLLIVMPYDAVARAIGDSRWILKNFICLSIFSLVAVILFASYFGALGALIGGLVARLALNLSGVIYTAKRCHWKVSQFVPLRETANLLIFIVPLSALCFFSKHLFTSALVWLLVSGSIFGVLTLALGWIAVAPRALQPKVLQVLQSLEIGGIEQFVVGLSCKLNPQLPTSVYTYAQPVELLADNDLVERLRSNGVEAVLRSKAKGVSIKEMFFLAKYIRHNSVTILQTHDLGGLIYASIANLMAGWSAKIVHTQHSFIHLQRKSHYKLLERIFSHCAARLIAISSEVQGVYKNMGFQSEIIGGGIELRSIGLDSRSEKLRAREEFLQRNQNIAARLLRYRDSKWLISVARLFPQKGQLELLKIWENLPESTRIQSVLLFIGPIGDKQYAQELQRCASKAARSERIFFLGASSEVEDWLRLGDIYISASASEGLPLAPLEALALGIRAFLSDIAGHSDFSAWAPLFKLTDLSQAAIQLDKILNNEVSDYAKESLTTLKRNASEVRRRYALQSVVEQYLKVYGQVAG